MARQIHVAIAIVVLVIVAAMGVVVLQPDPEPTFAPETIQGYDQTENITGEEAARVVTRLHRRPANVEGMAEAIVADYGSEDGRPVIRLYVSVYNESAMARDNISKMVRTIRTVPTLPISNTTVESTTVHVVEQEAYTFAFFSYHDGAYWVTVSRTGNASTEAVVREVITTNRDSRRAIPWP